MTTAETLLQKHGPMMSGKLAALLAQANNIPVNTASQILSRSNKIVKIKDFFQSRQAFCYLEEHTQSHNLYELLSSSMYEYGRKYWYCLNALKLNNGMLSKVELECYTNYPINKLKGHKPFSDVISNFIRYKIISYDTEYYYLTPQFISKHYNDNKSKIISKIKSTILNDFACVMKNTGMASYNAGEIYSEYSKLRWGYSGPSYVLGLRGENKKPGYILADVIIGNQFTLQDVDFFIKKVEHSMSFHNASRLMPYLLTDGIEEDALKLLKNKGIVIGLIAELFGQKYAESLCGLINILNNINAAIVKDDVLDTLSKIGKNTPTLVNNLRGSLFEFFVGYIVQRKYKTIDIGRTIYDKETKTQHEYDVFASNDDEVIVVECKATRSPITDIDIRKWQRESIPHMKKYIKTQDNLSAKQLKFEYWSISGFTEAAQERLFDFKTKSTKLSIEYYDKPAILQIIKELRNKNLHDTFNQYYTYELD